MPTEEGTTPVVNEVAEATAQTDSTPVVTKEPVLDEDGIDISFAQDDGSEETDETPTESPEPESEEPKADEEATEEPAVEEQEQPSKADARKEQLNTEIRDLVAMRNQIKAEVEAYNAEVYKPASVDELTQQVNPDTGDYYSTLEAKIEAMEQAQQVERYNNQVAEARLSLTTEAQRAVSDFPIFDADSSDYIPQLAAQVDQRLQNALVFDPKTKQLVGSRESPYTIYKTAYDAYRIGQAQAASRGQQAVTRMMNQADIPTNAPAPKSTRDDSKLDADAYAAKHGLRFHEF